MSLPSLAIASRKAETKRCEGSIDKGILLFGAACVKQSYPRMLCFYAFCLIWLAVWRDSQGIYAQDRRANIEDDFGVENELRSLQVMYQDLQAPLIEDIRPLMVGTLAPVMGLDRENDCIKGVTLNPTIAITSGEIL